MFFTVNVSHEMRHEDKFVVASMQGKIDTLFYGVDLIIISMQYVCFMSLIKNVIDRFWPRDNLENLACDDTICARKAHINNNGTTT